MKFSVESVLASGGRLGKMTCNSKSSNTVNNALTLDTPMCTLFTRGGSVPYLSQAMLETVGRVPSVVSISLGSLVEHHDSIAAFGKGIGSFTSMKEKVVFLTLHDASKPVASGKNDKAGIAVWGKGGKIKIEPPLYQRIVTAFQPDLVLALGDADTDETCARKRLGKAVNKTLDFLDDNTGTTKSEAIFPEGTDVIGSVVGGYNLDERKRSARETASRPVKGFLLEGFEKGHSGKDLFSKEDFPAILKATTAELPSDLPRMMETAWSPLQVVKAFRMGIDVFSSAYPHTLTEKGQAMTERLLPLGQAPPPSPSGAESETLNDRPGCIMDLKDERFREDFGPILSDCECYACKTFTCAYIHHLLNTSELLAYVLLTIHNFHRYFEFFHTLRQVAGEGKLDNLEQCLAKQQTKQ